MHAPDAAMAASCVLLSRARLIAHALVGVRDYRRADRLAQEVNIRWELRELLRGLDEAAVRSVCTTCSSILGSAEAHELVRMLWAETQADPFRGLS